MRKNYHQNYRPPYQCFSNGGHFALQKTFGNIWKHCWLSLLRGMLSWHLVSRGQWCFQTSYEAQDCRHYKELTGPESQQGHAKVEKACSPCSSALYAVSSGTTQVFNKWLLTFNLGFFHPWSLRNLSKLERLEKFCFVTNFNIGHQSLAFHCVPSEQIHMPQVQVVLPASKTVHCILCICPDGIVIC